MADGMWFASIQTGIERLKVGIATMSSTITGLSGIAAVLPSLNVSSVQASAKPPAAPAAFGDAQQPLLMVPTKPPLSEAVMAELMSRQSPSPYGALSGGQPKPNDSVSSPTNPIPV